MKLNEGLIYTNENCIGCNRCISGCPVLGANVSVHRGGRNHIYVDEEKCLHCGRCLDTCHHNAREYRDDTAAFLQDVKAGEEISLLVAPSFFIIYEKRASRILGYLKSIGVRLIYDVSYGADIATWAYLNYVQTHERQGAIAPPCSVVVNYIQKYSRVLPDHVIPVHSPLLCLAVYLRKYLGVTDKLAFLSPCIAKKDEIDDPVNQGLVQYNVTISHLEDALRGVELSGCETETEPADYGLGRIYPVPGGLSDNMKLFISQEETIREIHGERSVYDYLTKLEGRILEGQELPFLIDCLNCRQGCLSGTATPQHCSLDDDIFIRLQQNRKPNPAIAEDENPYLADISREERYRRLMQRFAHLNAEDFRRDYHSDKFTDERRVVRECGENEELLDAIFSSMHKNTPESRAIDCHSCGYRSCVEMATAVARGYNTIENCVHYLKDENLRVSMMDVRSGIPNFNAFLNFAELVIKGNHSQIYTAVYFNINNFKFINQKYGFRRGDVALRQYSAVVSNLADKDEIIATAGGNFFIGMLRRDHVQEVCERLLSVPIHITTDSATVEQIEVSSRIAVYEPDGIDTSPQMMVEKLSTTFGAINRTQNQQICYYDERLQQKQMYEDMIMHAVEPALRDREFQVFYQPKVDMKTHRLVGAEALIRWIRDGVVIPPMEFIPVCEKLGLVQKLDFYVLEEVCRHIVRWLEQGIRVVPVSVNFSKHHFVEDTVADRIAEIACRYGVPRNYLEIEFTETAYLDDSHNLISSIDKLHEYGISSSMDDFGTGYSSLSMLQDMSFDTLKLDKSFLHDGNSADTRCRTVIENIIRMAKELDMKVVSEGIETERELAYMRSMNCDIAQGYLFDRPLPRQEFEQRLIRQVYELEGME